MRKLLTAILALFLSAGFMPMHVMAEETSETGETFEVPRDYTIKVVCYANGVMFDYTVLDSEELSDEWKTRTTTANVHVAEGEDGSITYQLELPTDKGLDRYGYEFTGWYLDKRCTQPVVTESSSRFSSTIYMYAGWKEVEVGWIKTEKGWMYRPYYNTLEN